MAQLILTVTRACNLRCSYCPTAKDGWPALTEDDASRALDLFEAHGGGEVKLFGGEPLLAPEVVARVLDESEGREAITRVYLSTNGLGLDTGWLERLRANRKAVLTVSMDGRPEAHRRFRRALPGEADSYDQVVSLLPELARAPRVVITQTVAPASAGDVVENLEHLLELGFRRFNLLPGYYLPWRDEQLAALEASFTAVGALVRARWAAGEAFYLRNLFTRAPTPFFNTGFVVDSDRSIHPSNVGLSAALDELRHETRVGTLDEPPSPEVLAAAAARMPALLAERVPERAWRSTLAVDAALTRLCEGLYPDYLAYRAARKGAA